MNQTDPIPGVVHAATMLVVADLDASVAFYAGLLGFTVRERLDGLVLLARDGMLLYLVTESPPTPDKPGVTLASPPDRDRPPALIVFRVTDCAAAHAHLASWGVTFLTPPTAPPWGGLRCFAQDPDGFLVEIEQP